MEPLDTPHVVTCDYDGSDRVEEIIEICNKAFLRPLDSTCQCTNTTAEEIVRAIMAGARTIKDLHRMTGTGGGCGGYYCSNTMYRLLEAAGYPQTDHETTDTSDYETYHYIKPLLFTLPEGSWITISGSAMTLRNRSSFSGTSQRLKRAMRCTAR